MADRLSQLSLLAKQVPVLSEKAKQQADAAQAMRLQKAVGAAPPTPGVATPQLAQEIAPQQALQAGQTAVQAQATQQQQLAQVETLKMEEQRRARESEIFRMQQSTETKLAGQRSKLSQLGRDVEGKLLTSRLNFERDDMGQKFADQRQLEDWVVLNAKTEEEAKDKWQKMELASKRALQLEEATYQKISDILRRGWVTKEATLDAEQKRMYAQLQYDLQRDIERKRAKAAMTTQIGGAAGTIVGGVIGAYVGNVPGAIAGGAIGGGAGTAIGAAIA